MSSSTEPSATIRRSYAVGDVHGCCRTLEKMVEEALRLEKNDTLYLLGDYIDRGPDSKGVLDYLMQLSETGFDIRPLLGNHEEMLLQSAAGDDMSRRIWYFNGGFKTVQQFGVDAPTEIPPRYLDFLCKLPRVLSTDRYVLVHAGLDFSTPDPINDTSRNDMLWERGTFVDTGRLGGRTLVTGHTTNSLSEIENSLMTGHIMLDNGCWTKSETRFGNLVALDMDARRLIVVKNCDSAAQPG
ncbi:MAG TPA: serine/threonine protein phosphatase [Geobacter sp.]|nr:serine/threonine protein phosphatase [Geobacter sp.]